MRTGPGVYSVERTRRLPAPMRVSFQNVRDVDIGLRDKGIGSDSLDKGRGKEDMGNKGIRTS